MLRVSLIVVIVLGIGALVLSFVHVGKKIDTLTSQLSAALSAQAQAETERDQARRAEETAKTELETTRGELAETVSNLENAMLMAQQQRARADDFEVKLRSCEVDRSTAQQELARWRALDVNIQDVLEMKNTLLARDAEIAAINGENAALLLNIDQLKTELGQFVGPDTKVAMRDGLKGSIIAVDPKWDFVVLDVGENDGARRLGEMLVSRDGKLIGKVQITTLEPNRSVANILPQWKQGDVQLAAGDRVIY